MTSEGSVPASPLHDDARLAVIRAHGRTATAFRALGPELRAWMPKAGTLVAYAPVAGAAVAAGEPVAPLEQLIPVAEAFIDAMHAEGRRASFFATEGRLAHSPRLSRRLIGEQPVWDPRCWADIVRAHRSLREQLRRSRAKGVRVASLTPDQLASPSMRTAIAMLQRRWRALRSMPPMHFLVTQALHEGAAHRRTFVAMQRRMLVAVLSLAPVPARGDAHGGWIFEHLLRDPDAPNGTAELLVDHAMRALAADGVTWATLGLAPLHGPIDPSFARIRTWSRPLFNFVGLSTFKHKLRPQQWEPIYLAWPREQSGWLALVDGLRAFAGGSLVRFGVRATLRGPSPLLQLLEWMLVAWTALLAVAPTSPWFPSLLVQGGWVLFDGVLLLGLRTLRAHSDGSGPPARRMSARRRSARLAWLLAFAVSADAVLTIVEASLHRAPWHIGLFGQAVTLFACAGPTIAAAMLWGTARRARELTRPLVAPDGAA